jgi:hypothetical protein
MITLVSIDPGTCTGVALWTAGGLHSCHVQSVAYDVLERVMSRCNVIVELPQVYRSGQSKGDPNDLIKVAREVGRWEERAARHGMPFETVLPNAWKGQVPKPIHHARAREMLSPHEVAVLDWELAHTPKTDAHNMMDAVALGLWKLGRLRR